MIKGKGKAPNSSQSVAISSIDDIFGSSSKSSPQQSKAQSSDTLILASTSKPPKNAVVNTTNGAQRKASIVVKSKRRRRNKDDQEETVHGKTVTNFGERKVETVVDPSLVSPNTVMNPAPPKKKKKTKAEIEEDEAFRDSRGNRRKTEEGFLIYKEAELGINPEAGGTPLCPFDCDCCF